MKRLIQVGGILILVTIVVFAFMMSTGSFMGGASVSPMTVDGYYYDDVSKGAPIDMPESAPAMAYEESARASGIDVANSVVSTDPDAGIKRLVIKNADLAVVVTDPESKMTAIAAMAERLGGFVVSSSLYEAYTRDSLPVPEGSIIIRVPAEKLDEALKEIKTGVIEVQSESSNGQDITQAYTDLQSNLKNLEAAEAQLQQIMDKAQTTEDVINVFNQLTYYRQQIEIVKGQIKYYDESVALSAVSVRLIAEETIKPLEVAGWKPQGVARNAIQSLINFWQGFLSFLIWFGIFGLPVIIMIGLPIWLIWLGIKKWQSKRKTG